MNEGASTSDAEQEGPDPVQGYLAAVADVPRREALEHVRRVVMQEVPEAVPVRSHGLPAFRDPHSGGILCGFAATAKGCSLYPFSGSVVPALGKRLVGFSTTKGSIHFTAQHPLPDAVIRDVVALRRAEIHQGGR